MRKIIITSEKFGGYAELLYNFEEQIQRIDLHNAQMTNETVIAFKRAVPVVFKDINTAFGAGTIVAEEAFEISLADFKKQYPYSRNYHLLDDLWPKINKADQVQAYYAAIEYSKYCKRNPWYNAKIAATWLKNKEYKNNWKKM